ncbi:MAG TPA: efflux RND transporter periplasmic adaptor subunit [Candidatus Sulfotelmatobacter sp.]|nr:efflux RND transporter periplasmic adaptor subunit [Candidatus Sulfotelmatobacter sp.]
MRPEHELSQRGFVPRTEGRLSVGRYSLIPLGTALLLLVILSGCSKEKVAAEAPPPEVEVVPVAQQDVPLFTECISTLDGYVNAQIQPQVTGYLLKQNYQEGLVVHKGDVLFEIDPRPFEAALAQTQGQLAEAQAQLGKTRLDVARDTPLAKESAIPQAQLDNDIQANQAAEAQVAAAQAQVSQATLNLGFTKVRSLIDGIAGMAKAQIGDLVGPTTVLTTVSQMQPIKAYFAISEQEYLKFAGRIGEVAERKKLATGKRTLELILSDGTVYPSKGWMVLADRQVDVKTGTIRLAGAFDNPGSVLRPGMFGRIRAVTGVAKDALLVPQRAVVETQGSYSVVVVGPDNKASVRPVKTGDRVGQMWVITDGLRAGEQVIAEGMQKAKEGAPVQPKQFKPAAQGE